MRFNQGIHNILVERGIASENTAMLFMCFYGAIRQTNMATDSFNIYLSPVGVKSLNRFVINWQAGAKLIRHAHEYNGFVTLNTSTIKNVMTCLKGTRGYRVPCSLDRHLSEVYHWHCIDRTPYVIHSYLTHSKSIKSEKKLF